MPLELRFALIETDDPGLTHWQIHKHDCPDVPIWIKKGAFVAVVSSRSAEQLIHEEISVRPSERYTEDDYEIMHCCR